MMKRILVTGADGFVGSHLIDYLKEKQIGEVFGTSYSGSESLNAKLGADHVIAVDLTKEEPVFQLVKDVQPDWIIHLASIAVVGDSFSKTHQVMQANTSIQYTMLEAVRQFAPQARFLSIGSATCYGNLPSSFNSSQIREDFPFYPTNPYAVSKLTQEYLALSYYLAYGLDIVRVRSFNQIGPRQTYDFAVPAFAQQIVKIQKGEQEFIGVGNLSAVRDLTDVRDAVRAYVLLLEKGIKGEVYNLGSGHGVSMQSVLDTLIELAGGDIMVNVDTARLRPIDVPKFVADNQKLRSLGWEPTIPLETTLRDILKFEREK